MWSADELAPVVIDCGSGSCKAGSVALPTVEFPCVVGYPHSQQADISAVRLRDGYVGDEAQTRRSILTLKYPIERGVVTDWDDMEKASLLSLSTYIWVCVKYCNFHVTRLGTCFCPGTS